MQSSTSAVPEANKFVEMDFIPNCTGVGREWFHLAEFTSRAAVFAFYRLGKRKLEEPQLQKAKKVRLEQPTLDEEQSNKKLEDVTYDDVPPVDVFEYDSSVQEKEVPVSLNIDRWYIDWPTICRILHFTLPRPSRLVRLLRWSLTLPRPQLQMQLKSVC